MSEDRHWRLSTARLDLAQLRVDEVRALVEGKPEQVEALLGAAFRTPYAPPPLMDDALSFICGWLNDHPSDFWWRPWFFADRNQKQIIGSAGFSGPSETGALQLGYAIYPEHQGRGYATEAAAALVKFAWTDPGVIAVQATIPPSNSDSIRVAEKLGMVPFGEGEDDEVGKIIIYEIRRAMSHDP
jgi:[ribosomal protein S5]-alanine N-acetyltransferase